MIAFIDFLGTMSASSSIALGLGLGLLCRMGWDYWFGDEDDEDS